MNIGLGDILSTQGNYPVRTEGASGKVVVLHEGIAKRDIKHVMTPGEQAKVSHSNAQVKHAVAQHLAESGMGHKDQRKIERDFSSFLQCNHKYGLITSDDVKGFVKWEEESLTGEVFKGPDVPSSVREQAQHINHSLLKQFFIGDQLPDAYIQKLETMTKAEVVDRCDTELEQMGERLDRAFVHFDEINKNLKREGIDVSLLAATNVSEPKEFESLVQEQLKVVSKNLQSKSDELVALNLQEEEYQPLKKKQKWNRATGGLLFRDSAKRYKQAQAFFNDRRQKLGGVMNSLTQDLNKLSRLSNFSGGEDFKNILSFEKHKEKLVQKFYAISDLRESLTSDKGDSIIDSVRKAWFNALGANIPGRLEQTVKGNFEAWQGIQEKAQALGIEVENSKQILDVLGITKDNTDTVPEILAQIQEISEQDVDASAIDAEKKEQYVAFIKQLREFVLGAFVPIEDTGPVERMRRQELDLEGQTQQTVRENQDLNLEGQMQDIVGENQGLDLKGRVQQTMNALPNDWREIQEGYQDFGLAVETPQDFLDVLGINDRDTPAEIMKQIEGGIAQSERTDASTMGGDAEKEQHVALIKKTREFITAMYAPLEDIKSVGPAGRQALDLEGQMQQIVGNNLEEWQEIQGIWADLGHQIETPKKFLEVLGISDRGTVSETLQRIENAIGLEVDASEIKNDARREQYLALLEQSLEFARTIFTDLQV